MSAFVRIRPTTRNAPPRLLLNAHHIDRLQQGKQGLVIILKGAHAAEHIPVAESSHVIADAIKAESNPGRITVHECLDKLAIQKTTFDLANIRAVEPSNPGSTIRHGIDGSGTFEAYEDFDTVANLIEACSLKA
jgi:hypothetical protein